MSAPHIPDSLPDHLPTSDNPLESGPPFLFGPLFPDDVPTVVSAGDPTPEAVDEVAAVPTPNAVNVIAAAPTHNRAGSFPTAPGIPQLALTPDMILQAKLKVLRDRLFLSGSYMACPHIQNDFVWQKDGRCHRLVPKKAAELADAAYTAQVAAGVDPSVESVDLAPLAIIIHVTDDDFWLMPDALWRGPTDAAKTFSGIKLTCTGVAPPYNLLIQDYKAATATIEGLMKQVEIPGSNRAGVFMLRGGVKKLRFRHVPFLVL
jgi:hypothetical protein